MNNLGPLPERDIWRGYRIGIRTEPCACGGFITGSLDDPRTLIPTLNAHYAAPTHKAWRRRQGAQ